MPGWLPVCRAVCRNDRWLTKLQFRTKPWCQLHDGLLLLGFVLESINKLLHASSVSKDYCSEGSFTVADMLYGISMEHM